ncbi:MAG: hypothetical protein WD512_17495 [Candidatus Paceibacterota bacterium]
MIENIESDEVKETIADQLINNSHGLNNENKNVEINKMSSSESDDEDDDEEEVCEIEINGVSYYVSDDTNGLIYRIEKDGEIGRCVGKLTSGVPIFK